MDGLDRLDRRRIATQIAIYTRRRGPDDPIVVDLRRDWRYTRLREYIDKYAVGLTPEQRHDLMARVESA